MIGKIKLKDGTVATLDDDGKWKYEDKRLQYILNSNYNPRKEHLIEPIASIMPLGVFTVPRAAKELGAKVLHTPKIPPLPEGAVS
jgi:hypothetical protein